MAAQLMGVSDLAAAIGRSKGTISKHAAKGKIPIAERDKNGAPLFDLEAVQRAYENNMNTAMRRQGGAVLPPATPPELEDDEGAAELEPPPERRSAAPASAARPSEPGGLLRHQIVERQLRNRRMVRQLGEDEGRLVLRAIVEEEQVTIARKTRDSVVGFMADRASAAYAFAGQPRTEAEWRVWLSEQVTEAFNKHAATVALDDEDEFDDEQSDAELGPAGEPHAEGMA